jgi:hypothetical protein
VEDGLDERRDGAAVDVDVGLRVVEGLVEAELVHLGVLGEVDLAGRVGARVR